MRKLVIMMIMGVALMALPTMAQQQEWQSTSTMKGSGSSYSSQVNAVGAVSVHEMATTTSGTSSQNNGPHKAKKTIEDDTDPGALDDGSPIGDAVLPLMLMACAYLGMRVYLKRKRA